jgi:hypothetical protein
VGDVKVLGNLGFVCKECGDAVDLRSRRKKMSLSKHTGRNRRMKYFLLVVGTLVVLSSSAQADAPLKTQLST